jgi:hypothetical protein
MLADSHTTMAVAERESEELGKKGAQNYRNWLRTSGIWDKLALQTYDGKVVAIPKAHVKCSPPTLLFSASARLNDLVIDAASCANEFSNG